VVKKVSEGDGEELLNAGWTFGGDTAKSFSSHVRSSVPFYEAGHDLTIKFSDYFVSDDSYVYEIGSSTGTLVRQLAKKHKHRQAKFIGIDSEEAMTHQAESETESLLPNLEFSTADVLEYEFKPSDLMVSYYVIQFISPSARQLVIDKIYQNLNWGGGFIWFEKVRAPDARFQDYVTGLYNDYKLENNFTPDEILAKTRSLKKVLEPFSTAGNFGLLERAGFVDFMPIMKYLCFEGYIAIK